MRLHRSQALKVGNQVALQGLLYRDLNFEAPLDHFALSKSKTTITIFAREVWSHARTQTSEPKHYLCFFQGGPGFQSPSPSEHLAWLSEACKHFKVILLDQRGTGMSAPISAQSLNERGDSHDEQVNYLRFFRADSIVEDAELLRQCLKERDGARDDRATDSGRSGAWSILGQSFGGFCCVHYLSKYPDALLEVFLTGGLPPKIDEPCAAMSVYEQTFKRLKTQNEKYYKRFPDDVARVRDIVSIVARAEDGGVRTPAGNMLRPRTLQVLGLSALGGGGGFERLHFQIASAVDCSGDEHVLTPTFLKSFDAAVAFDTNPLYALLHEHCYTRGPGPRWAAQRTMQSDPLLAETFDPERCLRDPSHPFHFTGEMVFPWMFDDIAGLKPLKHVAEAAATFDGWTQLYDERQLRANEVPCAAASYCEDMYVDFELASETASKIKGIRQWMTNEYMHSGIRDDGARIFERLLAMTRNTFPLF